MNPPPTSKRSLLLPPHGTLLINTDLHGNGEDFFRLREIYLDLLSASPDAQWVILGDIVHGPDLAARKRSPHLYDYDDASMEIAKAIIDLQQDYPEQVHFVLGNHDHAHIGGKRTAKYYEDEAAVLEARLGAEDIALLHGLFESALLVVATPCGAALTHGAPGVALESLDELDGLCFDESRCTPRQIELFENILRSYGQPAEDARLFLDSLSSLMGSPQRFLIHGHDRDEEGFFVENDNQLCPCIFGAPREAKRYVLLDLEMGYENIDDVFRCGGVRRLYGRLSES